MRLSNATLPTLGGKASLPAYDRAAVRPGIVHLGIGAFFRSHAAVYVDDCIARGETGWGIVGASLRSPDTRDALVPQDGLYTLALRGNEGESLRVVGSVLDVLVAPEDPGALLDRLCDPAVRIVTLTITEKGYAVDLGSGGLRRDLPEIVHDLAHPEAPRSALGFLARAAERRREAGAAPFTLLSCDNLVQNGRTLKRVLVEFAGLRDPALAAYIEEHVACPCAMVDRIVPGTTPVDRETVAAGLGAEDAWPVIAEPFTQWVIEDHFPSGRPALEKVGVEFVAEVEPYEHMKLRLLNASHSVLAAIGRPIGLETVSDAIAVPLIREFVERYWQAVTPTLRIDAPRAHAYTRQLLTRYENTALRHKTSQIATDASLKLPPRILAPLRDCLRLGLPCQPLIFALAAWIRACAGYDEQGAPLPLADPTFTAWSGQPDQRTADVTETVAAFLSLGTVFGTDLPAEPELVRGLETALTAIRQFGMLEALRAEVPETVR